MSKEAGRVGVRPDQVDAYGRINSNAEFLNELILDLPVWTDLPVWKNGTEQVLPENDDEPDTSPLLADILYPDQMREDQYFLYRESPTTVDGKAKIRGIRGNILKWNQLVQNGNFANTNNWEVRTAQDATFSVNNNVGIVTLVSQQVNHSMLLRQRDTTFVNGHSYLFRAKINVPHACTFTFELFSTFYNIPMSEGETDMTLVGVNSQSISYITLYPDLDSATFSSGDEWTIKNCMIFDLTELGLTSLSQAEILKWFNTYYPLSYYAYTSGKLLPFKGEELKTTGFNQWDEEWEVGSISGATGQNITDSSYIRSKNFIRINPELQYYVAGNSGKPFFFLYYDVNGNYIGTSAQVVASSNRLFTPNVANASYCKFTTQTGGSYNSDICLNISSNDNGTYEPYTSYTNNLPTLDFYLTGMKAVPDYANNSVICDELLPDKAITRIGSVDLGTLDWGTSGGYRFGAVMPSDALIDSNYAIQRNSVCGDGYQWYAGDYLYNNDVKGYSYYIEGGTNRIFMKNTSYSSASDFKASLSGTYLYYELAVEDVQPTIIFE